MSVKFVTLVVVCTLLCMVIPSGSLRAAQTDALIGTHWELVSYGSAGAPIPVVAGSAITLEFRAENEAAGSGGCNSFSSRYTISGAAITFSAIVSTRKACADDLMKQEQAFFDALGLATRYTLTTDTLIMLYGDKRELTFRRVAALAGSQWKLVSLGPLEAQVPVVAGSTVTLGFQVDGQAGGSGGCNIYGGSYSVNGDQITFSAVISTLRACTDEAVTTQEAEFFDALQAARRFTVTADQLVILYGDTQALTFTRVDPLAQTSWQLVWFATALDRTPALPNVAITLEFGTENRVSGFAGCNTYNGTYQAERGTITLSRMLRTLRACRDEAVMAQEDVYLKALASARGFTVTGDQLIIAYGNAQGLVFTRVGVAAN